MIPSRFFLSDGEGTSSSVSGEEISVDTYIDATVIPIGLLRGGGGGTWYEIPVRMKGDIIILSILITESGIVFDVVK